MLIIIFTALASVEYFIKRVCELWRHPLFHVTNKGFMEKWSTWVNNAHTSRHSMSVSTIRTCGRHWRARYWFMQRHKQCLVCCIRYTLAIVVYLIKCWIEISYHSDKKQKYRCALYFGISVCIIFQIFLLFGQPAFLLILIIQIR